MILNTAQQLAILTERLSNHIDITERDREEERIERKLAAAERHEIIIKLKDMEATLMEVKPVTDMVQGVKAKITGAIILLGFLGTIVWGGVLFWKEQLFAMFHRIWGG